MKIAIISDIHSNIEALSAVEETLDQHNVDATYFAGDVVGYGPDPDGCTRWIMENAQLAVAGNHDHGVVGRTDIDSFNVNAREAVTWNAEQMNDSSMEYINSLPYMTSKNDVTLVHANPKLPESWDYIFTLWDAETNFLHFESTYCFVGHSHQPVIVSMDKDGNVAVVPGDTFTAEKGSRYLINVGSVGQPRDGTPDACFGILDTSPGTFSIVRSEYDFGITQEKILKAGLPKSLADRLAEGK